jgi:hypothetical protein
LPLLYKQLFIPSRNRGGTSLKYDMTLTNVYKQVAIITLQAGFIRR